MSYSTLLSRSSATTQTLELYHQKRIRAITESVSSFFGILEKKAIAKEQDKIKKKREKTLARRLRDEELKYKKAIKELKTGKKQEKPVRPLSVTKLKHKAYASFQLYCRLLRADKDGLVRLLDTGAVVPYTKAQAWHYRSKYNHPHLWFEVANCRPISPLGNKMQGDQPWYYRKDALIERIWQEMYDHLEAQAKQEDGIIRDRHYREKQWVYRKQKAEALQQERIKKQ